MKLAVTGATGFLGRHFSTRLTEEKDLEVLCVSRSLRDFEEREHPKSQWLKGDLCSLPFCRELVSGVDVILHLAHSSYPLTSELDLAGDIVSSVLPTSTLLQAVLEARNKPHIVFASSGGATYGEGAPEKFFTEEDPCLPVSGYGVQKLMIEHYIRILASRGHLTSSILRITNAYGTLLPANRRQGLIGVAMGRMLRGLPVPVFGNLNNVRDYVHLDDILECVKMVLPRRNSFEVFNVGAGQGRSVSEVLALLERVTGLKAIVEAVETSGGPGLVKCCMVSVEKAARELGWRPNISLEEGIARMYKGYRSFGPR